ITLPAADVEAMLAGLGMAVQRRTEGWDVTPPSWRFDIGIEADLLEEIARIYGYNRLPGRSIRSDLPLQPMPEKRLALSAVRRALTARGYQDAITHDFVDPKMQTLLAPGQTTNDSRHHSSPALPVYA